jgi:hypothetical protein
MTDKKLLLEYPGKRIKPVDGLAVTAQVWDEAHEFHRQQLRFHKLLLHGVGIVDGLEVIASDPPDSTVYVLPGMAVDPQGQVILVREPVAYDIGPASDLFYLVLTFSESRPVQEFQSGPTYVRTEFSIEVSQQPDGHGGVVLARLRRERGAPVNNARQPEFPGVNEIDLRFRKVLGGPAGQPGPALMGTAYLDGAAAFPEGHGASWLARSLRHAGRPLWVDDNVPFNAGLVLYDLVYLTARGSFQLSREQMNHLYNYIGSGGTLLMDCCLNGIPEGASPAAAAFADLAASFGVELQDVGRGHPLLSEPHLFSSLPFAYDNQEPPRLKAGSGLILSESDYGCLWQGDQRSGPAARQDIRSAMEWGENILAFALARKKEAASK